MDRVELFMDDGTSVPYGDVGGGAKPEFDLQDGEWITKAASYNYGEYQGGGVTFQTNLRRTYEAMGTKAEEVGALREMEAPEGQAIVGLVPDRSGGFAEAIFAPAPAVVHHTLITAFAHETFKAADRGSDGTLTKTELRKYFKAHPDLKAHIAGVEFKWKEFFALMDTDGDGSFTDAEYTAAVCKVFSE